MKRNVKYGKLGIKDGSSASSASATAVLAVVSALGLAIGIAALVVGSISLARIDDGTVTGPARPARTLFVAKSWSLGFGPPYYFTTIAAAIEQAKKLDPGPPDAVGSKGMVSIIVFPGTYEEPLQLISNIGITGTVNYVLIDAAVTWNEGTRTTTYEEHLYLSNLRFAKSAVFDTTGKLDNFMAPLRISQCEFDQQIAILRRNKTGGEGGTPDTELTTTKAVGPIVIRGPSSNVVATSIKTFSTLSIGTGTFFVQVGVVNVEGFTLEPGAIASVSSSLIQGPVLTKEGSFLIVAGSSLLASVTADTGSVIDMRSSVLYSGSLTGGGFVDRSITTAFVVDSVNGTNVVSISPPYNNNYAVTITQRSGSVGVVPIVTSQASNQLEFTDPVGGNTFEIILLQ